MCLSNSSSSELLQLEDRRLPVEGTGESRRVLRFVLISPPPVGFRFLSTRGEAVGLSSKSDSLSSKIWFNNRGVLLAFAKRVCCPRFPRLWHLGGGPCAGRIISSVEYCELAVLGWAGRAGREQNALCVETKFPAPHSSSSIELCKASSASIACA